MSAYMFAQIQIDDPDEYQNYLAGFEDSAYPITQFQTCEEGGEFT